MKKFKGFPKNYKRNSNTKLLWLYKSNVISYARYTIAKEKLIKG